MRPTTTTTNTPTTRGTAVRLFGAFLMLLGTLVIAPANNAGASQFGDITIGKSTSATNPTIDNDPADPNNSEVFEYVIDITCVSSTASCDSTVITDVLPATLEFVGPQGDPAYTVTPDTPSPGETTVEINVGSFNGSRTFGIEVQFRDDLGLAALETAMASNTATVATDIGGEPDSGTSNTVDTTGTVPALGGASAAKSIAPTSVEEFTQSTVTTTLSGTNTGTVPGDVILTDQSAAFFDAFEVTNIPAPAFPGTGVQVQIWDGTTWVNQVPGAITSDPQGVRFIFTDVPPGASVTGAFDSMLRDALVSGGEVADGLDATVNNTVTVDADYADDTLDDSATANRAVTVVDADVGDPRLSKEVAPNSVLAGSGDPVTFTLDNNWTSVGAGGLSELRFTEPGPNPFDSVDVTALTVDPIGTQAQNIEVIATCSGTPTSSGAIALTAPGQSIALPCPGDQIEALEFIYTPVAGETFPDDGRATVVIDATVDTTVAGGTSINNQATVSATSAATGNTNTANSNTATVNVTSPQFNLNHSKTYVTGEDGGVSESVSRRNTIILNTQVDATPDGARANSVVIQDPVDPSAASPTGGTDFFDQYDITRVRPNCPTGYNLLVEIYDEATDTWGLTTAIGNGNACAQQSWDLSADSTTAEGIRFTYTNPAPPPDGPGIPTVTLQPEVGIEWRDTNRETGDPQPLTPYDPDDGTTDTFDSATNDSSATVDGGTPVTDTAPPIRQTEPPASGGCCFAVQKTLNTPNSPGPSSNLQRPTINEFSNDTITASVVAIPQPDEFISLDNFVVQDPVNPENAVTGTYAGTYDLDEAEIASHVFAAVTDIQTVTMAFPVPTFEQVTIEFYNGTSWVAGAGPFTAGQTPTANGNPSYSAWRFIVEEDPANPGPTTGIEPSNLDFGYVFDVSYSLRNTFRSDVSVHAAGDNVRNNLCYGVDAAKLGELADGTLLDPCDYPFAPFNEATNDAGVLINDAQAVATGDVCTDALPDGDVCDETTDPTFVETDATRRSRTNPDDDSVRNRSIVIVNTPINATLTKRSADGSNPLSVPVPVAGATPGAQQDATIELIASNTTTGFITDELVITDADVDFWNTFDLRGASYTLPAGASVVSPEYTVTIGGTDQTVDQAGLDALIAGGSLDIEAISLRATGLPSGQSVTLTLDVRLNPAITTPVGGENEAALTLPGEAIDDDTDPDTITTLFPYVLRNSAVGVRADKTLALAAGEPNAVDLQPLLDATITATNIGDLPLSVLTAEDDDVIDAADYGTPPQPDPLPTSNGEFWDNVTFEAVTGLTFPTNADGVIIEIFDGTTWVSVAGSPFPTTVTPGDINAAITDPALVDGIRARFTSSGGDLIEPGEAGDLSFQVRLDADAAPGVALVNDAEAGLDSSTAEPEYQNPDAAAFTPQLGDLNVDVLKEADRGSSQPGVPIRYTLTFTNNGEQTIGVRDTDPLTLVDVLGANLTYDPAQANIVITKTLTDSTTESLTAAVDSTTEPGTLIWEFTDGTTMAAGESITIEISLPITPGTNPGTTVPNTAGIVMPAAANCTNPDPYANGRCTDSVSVNVTTGGATRAAKTIDSGAHLPVTTTASCSSTEPVSYPCVATTPAGSTFDWTIEFQNAGNTNLGRTVLIDRFPAPGDSTIVGGFDRGSEWTSASRGTPTVTTPGLTPVPTLQYLPAGGSAACFDEVTTGTDCGEWLDVTGDIPADAIGVRLAADYDVDTNPLQPGDTITITWPETAPNDLVGTADSADPLGQANSDGRLSQWNSYSFSVDTAGSPIRNTSIKAGAVFDSAALEITKTVVDNTIAADPTLFGPFQLNTVCTFNGTEVLNQIDTVSHDTTVTINGLPSGTECEITEVETANASAVDVNGSGLPVGTVTVTADTSDPTSVPPVLASVTNTFDPQTLDVTKAVEGVAPAGEQYDATVSCSFNGTDLTLDPAEAAFTLTDGSVQNVVGLPVGAMCLVDENTVGAADLTDVRVTDADSTDELTENTTSAMVLIGDFVSVVEFTNVYLTTPEITKTVIENTAVDPADYGPFTIDVTCPLRDGSGDVTVTEVISHGESFVWDTATNGEVLAGASCSVTETDSDGADQVAIDGTVVAEGAAQVVTTAHGVTTIAVENTFNGEELLIEKTVEGADAAASYDFDLACTFRGDPVAGIDPADTAFSLLAGESRSIAGLPAGAECTVTETATGAADFTEVSTEDASGTEVTEQTATPAGTVVIAGEPTMMRMRFNNVFLANPIVEKDVQTESVVPDELFGPFSVDVVCDARVDPTQPFTSGTTEPETLTFTTLRDGTPFDWTVEGGGRVLAGSDCQITETDTAGADSTTVNATEGASGTLTTVQGDSTAVIVNTFETNELTVGKVQRGQIYADETATEPDVLVFGFETVCSYADPSGIITDITGQLPAEDAAFTIAGDGTKSITGLVPGVTCTVTEVETAGADRTEVTVTDRTSEATAGTSAAGGAIEFTNSYLSDVNVTKEVVEDTILPPEAFGPFEYEVTCVNPSVGGADPESETVEITDIFTGDSFGWTGTMELLAGATCEIVETATGNAQSVQIDGNNAESLQFGPIPQGERVVGVENLYDPVVLSIGKVVRGELPEAPAAQLDLACTYNGRDLNAEGDLTAEQQSFALAGGETVEVPGLPVGTECNVTETDAGGADYVQTSVDGGDMSEPIDPALPPAVEITTSLDGNAVTFVNSFVAEFNLTKSVENETFLADDELGPFTFDVTCQLADGTMATETVELANGDTFEWTGGELLAGTSCMVTETAANGATTINIGTVDVDEDAPVQFSDLAQGPNSVTAVNTFASGDLTVTKTVTGPAPAGASFTFTPTCSFNGDDLALSSFDLASGGTFTIENLPIGADCNVAETDTANATRTEVSVDGGGSLEATGGDVVIEMATHTAAFENVYVFEPKQRPNLPVSGSQIAVTLLLAGLAIGGGLLFLGAGRRRRDEQQTV